MPGPIRAVTLPPAGGRRELPIVGKLRQLIAASPNFRTRAPAPDVRGFTRYVLGDSRLIGGAKYSALHNERTNRVFLEVDSVGGHPSQHGLFYYGPGVLGGGRVPAQPIGKYNLTQVDRAARKLGAKIYREQYSPTSRQSVLLEIEPRVQMKSDSRGLVLEVTVMRNARSSAQALRKGVAAELETLGFAGMRFRLKRAA